MHPVVSDLTSGGCKRTKPMMMKIELPSLLITDDDRDLRETLQGVFEPHGYRTLLAGDGEEALQILNRETVHLLLLDMHMPRLTGLETVHRLKQTGPFIPCILMSAGLDELLAEEARRADVFTVLRKPLSFREIRGTVDRVMQQTYGWPE